MNVLISVLRNANSETFYKAKIFNLEFPPYLPSFILCLEKVPILFCKFTVDSIH